MRLRSLLVAPLAAIVLLGPLAACSAGPEEQACAVLEADGDDYVELPDPALCPPPGASTGPRGPLWVPVSQLDTDDDHHRTTRTTAKAKPRTTTPKATPKKTATSRSR